MFFISNLDLTGFNIAIIDKETNLPIPYISYTRLSDFKGSFANEDGIIEFGSEEDIPYLISCVGYQSDTFIPKRTTTKFFLKPKLINLEDLEITAKKSKNKVFEIGYLSGFSIVPYYAALPRKMAVCTFIPNNNKEKKIAINDIKIDIGANKSKNYKSFLIRLFIKENEKGMPGEDLLKKDMVVTIKEKSYKYSFPLEETIIIPKNGCFVGFETIGKIDKNNKFIAFTDFYEKPQKPFEFTIRKVKSDSYSLVKFGSFPSWFKSNENSNKPETYAIGMGVVIIND